MPRDDWAKARSRDKARKSSNGTNGNVTRAKKNRVRGFTRQQDNVLSDRLQSWAVKLWFGRFKGQRLRDCPAWYLKFLSELKPTSRNMEHVVEFLKKNLEFGSTVPVPSGGDEAPVSTRKLAR